MERLYSPPEIGAPGRREARARRRDIFYAGLFVLAMVGVTLAALALLSPGLFGGTYRLRAYFPDAEGLDQGIRVIQEGYTIGIVERVAPVFPGRTPQAGLCPSPPPPPARPDGAPGAAQAPARSPALPCFRAVLRIRERWPVPADSLAQVGSAGLLKGDAIMVAPGGSERLLGDGDTLATLPREADLMARLGALTDALDRMVTDTVAPALASIRAQIRTLETLIGSGTDQGENRARLAGAFENLRKLTEDLERAVDPDKIAAILGAVERMSGNLAEESARLGQGTSAVREAVREYQVLAKDIQGLVQANRPALQGALDDTRYLLQELSATLTPILANIEDATRNLSALSQDVRENPSTLLRNRPAEDRTPWFR